MDRTLKAVSVWIVLALVWRGLELLLYGEIQPRTVDDIMWFLFLPFIYMAVNIDSVANKLKKEEPQNSISRIPINKVDCCENCGDKNFLVTNELGISHRRIRLCKNCFKDLSDAINSALEDEN